MKKFKLITLICCSLILLPYSLLMANEEAKYEVIDKNEIYEIRKYSDRLAVETSRAGIDSNFRKLFNYISGRNDTQEKIAMTTPVTQVEKDGNMTMQFYLPSKFNSDNVPNPSRDDVRIVNIEGGYYAVLRYSGRASDGNFIKHKEILEKELNKNNISIISPPIRATYDSPFTLPMNRRNEAMYKVEFNS
ncbi:SOUL family heme-binding protein [Candidatus Pelagibacter communis]|jgi:DNA gyrase inhibitor GyrI|uniref:SOUL family heme-binding protein n=1 Tax=Pelagibacter ubique TaxID=198252 RepID=UPI00065B41B9|nr:heme-binding protein [Candidatus Pelagibacter ubique]